MTNSIINLDELYQSIYEKGVNAITNHNEYVDLTIDDSSDTRMGLTLTIRPHAENDGIVACKNIENFIDELKEIEREQYYYPQEDFHITLLDLVVARQDFKYTKEQVEACITIAKEAIKDMKPLHIEFQGAVASDGAILIKGYYQDEFEMLRQKIRTEIDKSILPHDERYPARSCHMTVSRFRKQIKNRDKLQEKIMEYRNSYFGELKVKKIELVCHNWFDSKKEILAEFLLAED